MAITKIFYHTDFENHIPTLNNPECSKRVANIINLIKEENFANISFVEPNKIKKELIYAAHDKNFVDETLNKFPENDEIVYLDQETPVSQGSKDATLRAAGAGIDAVESILDGSCKNAFCIVRPPGHHACIDRSMGFCVFNNVAVAAHYLINKYSFSNIAIIDFDVHHGNGTQDIFYNNKNVNYYSTHQFPLYPGTGDLNETGVGNIFNVPLVSGTASDTYKKLFQEKIINQLKIQKPDFMIISAGFDAHSADPLANINLVENDFSYITDQLKMIANNYCEGRLLSMLEGGYDINALEQSILTHIKILQT
ncbi:histone deacetylase family protein [bacterium]|jgi:acetoin utilization deacetylase AcuC-like enzyme|nr:histone deacetylase family protein [bacterium]|tara:strand:- start:4882 stop:5811 length:930 start_codon:yes stop_codon:yes gene_type:complete